MMCLILATHARGDACWFSQKKLHHLTQSVLWLNHGVACVPNECQAAVSSYAKAVGAFKPQKLREHTYYKHKPCR